VDRHRELAEEAVGQPEPEGAGGDGPEAALVPRLMVASLKPAIFRSSESAGIRAGKKLAPSFSRSKSKARPSLVPAR
jgi:hypothetical protein